ncbi:uncharacterized protein [Lolium perenne]|uniref:uncharacterized protein isoform X1 n=1 Tax=Lolium perenne TaxID=4522 RepID=UPI0021F5239E|nr:uncharacterized protein LOC127331385 isoform X1 [Lolium perenne]
MLHFRPPSEPDSSAQTGKNEGLPSNYLNLTSEPAVDLPVSDDLGEQRTHVRILVSDSEADSIIGRGGSAVTALQSTSGALVKVSRRGQLLPGTGRRVLLVSGLFHQVMDAAEIILKKILYQGGQVIDERATVVLVVPDASCGVLIGKGGTNIKSLAEVSNAGIVISPHDKYYGLHDRLVTITGNLDNQLQAIFLILSELLEDDRYSRIYAGATERSAAMSGSSDEDNSRETDTLPSPLHLTPAIGLPVPDILDTRLETWDDPTPRESEFSLKDLGEQWTHVRILVSDSEAGSIIGRGGSTVTALQSTSGALVKVSRRGQLLPGTGRRVLLVSGLFHQVMDAAEIILKKILYQGGQVIDERATVVLVVPDASCGVLIGKGGTNIKSLAEVSNAGIVISPHDKYYGLHDRLVTITGNLDNQLQAIFLILSELLEDDRYSRIYAGATERSAAMSGSSDEDNSRETDTLPSPLHLTPAIGLPVPDILDTRLETWDDPTPRESEFSLKDLRGAFIAAARQHSSVNTMPLTREERLKRRDKNDRNSLMIALEVYTKKHNLQSSDFEIVQVQERNLIDEYGKGYIHFNFVVRGLNGEVKKFFAEVHPNIKDDTGVYLCTPLEENDKGHCYGCKDRANGLAHPNGGGFLGGHKEVGFPFMEFED